MTLYFTEEEQENFHREQRAVHFSSSLGFPNAHNGFRRGSLHLIIGTTGGGKSTLIRTLIRDLLFKKDNASLCIAIWLSEETLEDYKRQVSFSLPASDVLLKTMATSEIDWGQSLSEKGLFDWVEMCRPDVLIMDNITTSAFYMDKRPHEQAAFARKLKEKTKSINCATLVVAHTKADITESYSKFISVEDINGSKAITKLAEFAYILQRFAVKNKFFPTLRIVKHRSQDLVHDSYLLNYEPRIRAFISDTPIDFDRLKEIFDARNRL